jgi:hypothetical protein
MPAGYGQAARREIELVALDRFFRSYSFFEDRLLAHHRKRQRTSVVIALHNRATMRARDGNLAGSENPISS